MIVNNRNDSHSNDDDSNDDDFNAVALFYIALAQYLLKNKQTQKKPN